MNIDQVTHYVKRNASTILTCIGMVGVAATAVTAVKATPKALILLEAEKKKKGEKLTKIETIKVAGPAYIPSIIIGVSTITCIFGANYLNKQQQATLASAYALLDRSYREYRNKVKELYGESEVQTEIAKDHYNEEDIPEDDGKELFYDTYSKRYFRSTIEEVQRAEYYLNRNISMRDYAYLNEFYEMLGLEPIEPELGWSSGGNIEGYWRTWIDFTHELVTMDDGLECHVIMFQKDPYLNFEDY